MVSGDMLELGEEGVFFHERLGHAMVEAGVDMVVGVGPLNQLVVKSFLANQKEAKAEYVRTADQALDVLKTVVKEGDSILIKGSHGMGLGRLRSSLESLLAAELTQTAR